MRYARRLRNRRRPRELSDADLLACLISPVSSVADLVARRRRSAPLLPATLASSATAKVLRDIAPAACEPILAAGRTIRDGIFDLLGSGPIRLGPIPDWHRDFKAGMRWD